MNDVDKILDKIRENAATLSAYHRKRYITLKSRLKYYRLPVIILSALNSVCAVSMNAFVNQSYVSLINMAMSLIVGIIGSIELFYGITRQMEVELVGSKDFYVLSIDIYKYLSLDRIKRETDERIFLTDTWTRYTKLIETSYILKKKVADLLTQLPTSGIPSVASSDTFTELSNDDTPDFAT